MTTWRYRVTKDARGFYGISEYYEDENGNRRGVTDPVKPIGWTELGLIQDLRDMLRAFEEPVIDMEDD